MKWLKVNLDRVVLIVVSLVVLCLSIQLFGWSGSLETKFRHEAVMEENRARNLPDLRLNEVSEAMESIAKSERWESPTLASGQSVPIFNSVPVIQKEGQLFVLSDSGSPPVRPPFTNEYLLRHGLDFRRSDIGRLDPDDDGFSNLEEFHAGTDPLNVSSHPPLTNKLFLQERIELPYGLLFKSRVDDLFEIEQKPEGEGSGPVRVGDRVFGGRFELVELAKDESGRPNVLVLSDSKAGGRIRLEKGLVKDLPSFQAVLVFGWKGRAEIRVKPGEVFQIGQQEFFKLLDLSESGAVIAPSDQDGSVRGDRISIPGIGEHRVQTRNSAPALL